MNEALIAKLGLEKSAFEKGLKASVDDAAKAGRKITENSLAAMAARERGAKRAIEANEELFRSERRVETGAAGLAKSLSSMSSVSDVAAASVESLHSILKLPIGVGIGIAAAAAGYEKLSEAAKHAHETHAANTKILNLSPKDQANTGSEDMKQDIGKINEAAEETRKTLSDYSTTLADFYSVTFLHKESVVNQLLKDQIKLEERKFALADAIAGTLREEGAARDVSLHQSERQGALLKAQAEMEAQIAKVHIQMQSGEIMPQAAHAEIADAKSKGADATEAINQKYAGAERSLHLENEILDIKRQGLDVDVKSGEARVHAAEMELAAARTSEAKAGAETKLTAERDALQAAKQVTTQRQEQMGITIAIAHMQADASAKQMAELQLQSAELVRQRRTATPDELAHIDVAQAQNQSSQQDLLDKHQERMFSLADQMTASSAGNDQASQMRALQGRASIADSHAEALQANPRASTEQVVAALDLAKKLRLEYDKIAQANEKTLRDTEAETQIMAEQLAGHDQLAAKLKIEADFQGKILAAQRDGNTELAGQLAKQQQIALAQNTKTANKEGKGDHFVADKSQTPQQQNAARLTWLKDQQAREAHDRANERDARREGKQRGAADPDVGNRSVAPHTEPGMESGKRHMPGPTHMPKATHMPDRSFQHGPGYDKHAMTPAPAPKAGGITKADLDATFGSFVNQLINGISATGQDV